MLLRYTAPGAPVEMAPAAPREALAETEQFWRQWIAKFDKATDFRWVNGRDPRRYGLDFGLWTRSVVASLIEQKFGVRLGLTAIGELLAKLGLTPQKPLQRAYQRDPDAIETWRRETFPNIARQAKAAGLWCKFSAVDIMGLMTAKDC